MKKIILGLIGFSLFYSVSFGASVQTGSIPNSPYYTNQNNLNSSIDILVTGSVTTVDEGIYIYDKTGLEKERLGAISGDLSKEFCLYQTGSCFYNQDLNFIIETENANYFYFKYNRVSGGTEFYDNIIFKYNKATKALSKAIGLYGGFDDGAICRDLDIGENRNIDGSGDIHYFNSCISSDVRIGIEENNLIIGYSPSQKVYIDLTDQSENLIISDYLGSTSYLDLISVNSNYLYRGTYSTIQYLDENFKTFEFVNIFNGIVNVFSDTFVSTWAFDGYRYLYDTVTETSYLSIFGHDLIITSELLLRRYFDYQIGSFESIAGKYFIGFYNNQIIQITDPLSMGYDYFFNNHQINLFFENNSGSLSFVYIDELFDIYEDDAIIITDYLIDTSSGGVGTGDNISDQEVIGLFDIVDLNDDGEVSTIEYLQNLVDIPARLWRLLGGYLDIFYDFIDSFMGHDYEAKTLGFSFIANANASFGDSVIGNIDNQMELINNGDTPMGKIYKMFKVGMLFIGLMAIMILFFISRK